MSDEPKLAPPGAGLRWYQRPIARFLIGRFASKKLTWEENLAKFSRESEKIEALLARAPKGKLTERVLVAPRFGLEDSSRFWSIAMALEHLVIVGNAATQVVILLSRGEIPRVKADTAKVKPRGELSEARALAEFRAFTNSLARKLAENVHDKESKATHAHPWFGPFMAKQWVWLLGVHQTIHRKQIEDILAEL